MVQWLRLHIPSAGGPGSISDGGTRSHMLQLRDHMLQLKIPLVETKSRHSQINKYFFKKNVQRPGGWGGWGHKCLRN